MTRMANQGKKKPCSLIIALRKLGGSWKLLVLRELWNHPRRFSDIRKSLPWISATSLARTLKSLEEDGFISRSVVTSRPPKVTYTLLQNDEHLREIIDHLTQWGRQHSSRAASSKF